MPFIVEVSAQWGTEETQPTRSCQSVVASIMTKVSIEGRSLRSSQKVGDISPGNMSPERRGRVDQMDEVSICNGQVGLSVFPHRWGVANINPSLISQALIPSCSSPPNCRKCCPSCIWSLESI